MGLSNLTSSIRATEGVCITGLNKVAATTAIFKNLAVQNFTASHIDIDLDYTLTEDGILTIHDPNREKRLSVDRSILSFSLYHKNIKATRWLRYNNVGSNVSGFRLIRNATLTSVTVQTQSIETGTFKIIERNNTISTDVTTVVLTSEAHKTVDNLNIDINKGSVVEVKLISGEFSYPTFSIEFAWRF